MKKEFDKQQLTFERIPAVDAALLKGDEYLLKIDMTEIWCLVK